MTELTESTRIITFEATVETIDAASILRLPESASRALPSRGQVAVEASLNGRDFATVLEPDGVRGHWMRIDPPLRNPAGVMVGDTVEVTVTLAREWPEPDVPADLLAALAAAPPEIMDIWHDITPMARWEWVRWVNATANPATRERRVEVTISKMGNGKRRPCCFDLASCTDPAVAKNGKLRSS